MDLRSRSLPAAGLIWLFAAAALIPDQTAAADCPRGTATGKVTYIRDGDTLELGALAIRLQGLAAPEGEEPPAATKPQTPCGRWCSARR